MDLFKVIRERRSVRKFASQEIGEDLLLQILQAANRAPSAGNLQAYRIFVVQEPRLRQTLSRATGGQECLTQAPVILVFCAEPTRSAAKYGSRGEQLYCIQDATIACSYAQLAATALGLATVWIGAVFEPETIREALGFKEDLWPMVLLPIGYPAENPKPTSRRKLSELVHTVKPDEARPQGV